MILLGQLPDVYIISGNYVSVLGAPVYQETKDIVLLLLNTEAYINITSGSYKFVLKLS